MTSYVTPKKATQYICYVSLVSQADTDIMQDTPTLAAGDVKVSLDGGALANLATLPAVTPASSKMVGVILSADEMDADNVTVVFCDAAGDEWQDLVLNIQTTAQQIDDLSTVTEAQVNAQCDTALTDYDGPTNAEMNTAHGLLATPAQVATALTNYDGPTDAEMDAGFAALNDPTTAEIWANADRTLTMTAAEAAAAISGSKITITRGDTLIVSITGLGSLAGYVSLDFTVKDHRDDADSAAVVWVRKNASGENDGLLIFNGAAGTAENGSITIDDEDAGDITIRVEAEETDDLVERDNLYYDVQMITASTVTTKTDDRAEIVADVTKAVV